MRLTNDAPSKSALHANYAAAQKNSRERILDDRPEQDRFIAPIDLLYQPFGYFDDARRGVKIPGEEAIKNRELWRTVDTLAGDMLEFFKDEKKRTSKFVEHLIDIFKIPIAAGVVGGTNFISDGHCSGVHKAMVFCVQCKNEATSGNCDPVAQLVAHIAVSFNYSTRKHKELFKRWRVPALGMTHLGKFCSPASPICGSSLEYSGPNIQFFGIVWMGQIRLVPLTPQIPMACAESSASRLDLVLAFKAASLVLSKLQADVDDLVKLFQSQPEASWPSSLTGTNRRFPAITEVTAFPDSKSEKLKFIINSRHDQLDHRHLYHARLISPPAAKAKDVYVKFTRSYSVELHDFCASKKLAPAILGFERLSGGWFAVVMEKIDEAENDRRWTSEVFQGWKKSVGDLVEEFHGRGLVHGDLRLANFVFTESDGALKMLLVDFDWGGKVGEAVFPPMILNDELGVEDTGPLLNRKITIEHDRRCLEEAFQRLNMHTSQRSVAPPALFEVRSLSLYVAVMLTDLQGLHHL